LFVRPKSNPTRRRLHVEALEGRLVPTTFHVTSLLDDGSAGTLRWAINQANANPGPDTIDFQVTGMIELVRGQLPAFTDAATTTVAGISGRVTLDAHGSGRIFQVNPGANVALSGLELIHGGIVGGNGGGISNAGTLSLTNCNLDYNSASPTSGTSGIVQGGGIYNSPTGTLSLTNCDVSYNDATGGQGGGIYNDGKLTLTSCKLSDNGYYANSPASNKTDVLAGGGIYNSPTGKLSITDSTLSGNTAGDDGAGIYNSTGTLSLTGSILTGNKAVSDGGGICNSKGTLSLTNCTLSGNQAEDLGGGIANQGGSAFVDACTLSGNNVTTDSAFVFVGRGGGGIANLSSGKMSLTDCTLASNGAGIFNAARLGVTNCTLSGNYRSGIDNGSFLELDNSIVANNGIDIENDNAVGVTFIGGHNLTGAVALGPLADNGGPTQTMALPVGSPALGAADPGITPVFDQRGLPSGFDRSDIGAWQAQAPTLAPILAAVTVNAGSQATNTGTFGDADALGTVTLTASLGTVTGDTTAGTWGWSYTPPFGSSGLTTVTITATNAYGLKATTSFTLTVNYAVGLLQGGFEAPNLGTGSSAYQYDPSGTAWTFAGNAGVAGNGSAFTAGNPAAPEGTQVAFLQGYGSISQAVTVESGTYILFFSAAQRANYQASSQTFAVEVDGAVVGTFKPAGTAYAAYATAGFTLTAGAHTITFVGLDPDGRDNTAFLDQVQFAQLSGLNDAGFELPSLGTGSYQYDPSGTAWTFAGTAGVAGNGSAFTAGNTAAPEGTQVAFLQETGSISQAVEVAAGSYIVRFSAAQRANVQASSQTFAVEVDGAVVGTFTPAGTGYAAYATAGFTLTAGAHTITFVGLDPDGLDNTAFLDQVQLVQTPALTALSASASSLAEGRSISLSGSFTDDPAHDQATTAVVNWGDGSANTTVNLGAGVLSFSGVAHQYTEESAGQPNGSYTITVVVSDPATGSGTATTSVAVSDAPLTDQTAATALSAQEGAATGDQVVASFSDADPNAVPADYTATIYWGDGSSGPASAITQSGGIFSVHGAHTYAEEGTYHPYATVTDNEGNPALTGGSTVTTSQILVTETVAAVAPTAAVSGPGNGVPGQPRTFTFSASDSDPTDQAAGFVYTVTWGDGSAPQTIAQTTGNGSGVEVDHVYTAPGTYSVTVTATEDGGTTSVAASSSLTVQAVQMQGGTLAVGGTPGNDTITLSPADSTGDIAVQYNGTSLGTYRPTDHILVYGQSGNDTIQLQSTTIGTTTYYITVPAFLYGGGTGTDILDARGSTANNVLTGGGGTNTLYGGLGRDLLIAGLGQSQLNAGTGDDLLIGGSTTYDLTSGAMTYDQKLAALDAIMAEWGSTDSYTTRVNDLLGGGGLNGPALLNTSTVHDNGKVDTLIGTTGSAVDWFLAGLTDVVKHKTTGEVQTTIS
jgi:hypothetical protein